MRRLYPLALTGTAAVAAGLAWHIYRRDIVSARARIAQGSHLLSTRSGIMEYGLSGQGSPLLVIHGAGGGFDQGLDLGRRAAESGWQVIAPSRFGYLRSEMPQDASPAAQADAFADLLDALDIERLPVFGVSAGGLSAIAFAIRHPERCSALVLMAPAAYVAGRPASSMSPAGLRLMRWALLADLPFWAAMRLAKSRMIGAVLGTDPALVRAAPLREQERALAILRSVLPISARTRGLINDGTLAGSPPSVDYNAVRAPTLVISAEDDLYGSAANARHLAAHIPGSRLAMFRKGGHIFVGQDDPLFAEVSRFLEVAQGESVHRRPSQADASLAFSGSAAWSTVSLRAEA